RMDQHQVLLQTRIRCGRIATDSRQLSGAHVFPTRRHCPPSLSAVDPHLRWSGPAPGAPRQGDLDSRTAAGAPDGGLLGLPGSSAAATVPAIPERPTRNRRELLLVRREVAGADLFNAVGSLVAQ